MPNPEKPLLPPHVAVLRLVWDYFRQFGTLPSQRSIMARLKISHSRESVKLWIQALLDRELFERAQDMLDTKPDRDEHLRRKQRGYRIARSLSPAVIPMSSAGIEDPRDPHIQLFFEAGKINGAQVGLFALSGDLRSDEFEILENSIVVCERKIVNRGELEVLADGDGWKIERRRSGYPAESIFLRAILTSPK